MPVVKVTLADIMLYLVGKSRPVIEGEAVFRASHVILCEVEDVSSRKIFALCLQSSALKSPPHEVKLNLGPLSTSAGNWVCECTCKAGLSGYCKHVVAVMLYINRNEELDHLSCTDVKQIWGKEKKKVEALYNAERAVDFWHFQKKRRITFKSNEKVDKANEKLLLECKPSSAISIFYKNAAAYVKTQRLYSFHNFMANIEPMQLMLKSYTFFTLLVPFLLFVFCFRLSTSGEHSNSEEHSRVRISRIKQLLELMKTSEFMGNVHIECYSENKCCKNILSELSKDDIMKAAMCEQGSKEWENFRKLRLTGTSIYSIFTYGKGNWEEKAIRFFWPKSFSNKFVKHGKKYEKYASAAFENKYPDLALLTTGFLISERYPWLGFSPDGIIFKEEIPYALLEIKCPFMGKTHRHDDENFIKSCDYLEIGEDQTLKLKEKHQYFGQVQLGMAISGVRHSHLIIYSSLSDDFLELVIEYDERFAKNLIVGSSTKYLKYILHEYCKNKDSI